MHERTLRRGWLSAVAAMALSFATPISAKAFCGFYVKQASSEQLTSRAGRVVLLRDGTTTVLTMQNSYEGPPEDFALIVPVSAGVTEDDVRTLEAGVLERLDQLTAPRLVEYWEQPPVCFDARGRRSARIPRALQASTHVAVEAQFAVGEYDVAVLGADDSSALEAWLRAHDYRIPAGATAALRPYVEQGMQFLVARVDATRVHFEGGRAMLSPLRIRYESEQLTLPVRLGTLSSPGEQDLVVHVISREGRFEVSNRTHVLAPTNLVVRAAVRSNFNAFYGALLTRLWEREPGAVVTEYAWSAGGCDPCTAPPMNADDLTSLGGDQIAHAQEHVTASHITWGSLEHVRGRRIHTRAVRPMFNSVRERLLRCVRDPIALHAELTVDPAGEVLAAELDAEGPRHTLRCLRETLRGAQLGSTGRGRGHARFRMALRIDRRARRSVGNARGFTVTRMRYRYGANADATDLVFRAVEPVQGGNGMPNEDGELSTATTHEPDQNRFQARYALLHRWRGASVARSCRDVGRGWAGPPEGGGPPVLPSSAWGASSARRVVLERMLESRPQGLLGRGSARVSSRHPRRATSFAVGSLWATLRRRLSLG